MPHQIKDFLDEILYFQQQPGLYLERQNWFKVSDYFFLLNHNWPTFCENVLSWPRCSCESFQPRCCRRPPAAGLCCRTGRIIQSDSRWEAASAEGGGEVRHLTTLGQEEGNRLSAFRHAVLEVTDQGDSYGCHGARRSRRAMLRWIWSHGLVRVQYNVKTATNNPKIHKVLFHLFSTDSRGSWFVPPSSTWHSRNSLQWIKTAGASCWTGKESRRNPRHDTTHDTLPTVTTDADSAILRLQIHWKTNIWLYILISNWRIQIQPVTPRWWRALCASM